MKLFKKNGIYHAAFKASTGERRTITTKQTDLAKAKTVAKESGIAELEQAGQSGRLTQQVIGRITTGKSITILKAIPPFRKWMEARGRSPKTTENVIITVQSWAREADCESQPPSAITETHIASWVNDEAKERNRASRLVVLGHLHTFFGYCASQGWTNRDPSQAVAIDFSVLSHEQKESAPREPFSPAELSKLIAYIGSNLTDIENDIKRVEDSDDTETVKELKLGRLHSKHFDLFFWLFAVRCSAETGLRLSDIAGLEWRCFEAGKLVVWQEKTNQRIEHNLSPIIEEMVTRVPATSHSRIFPEQHAIVNDVKRRALLSVTFKRICERAGVMGKSFHSLRHSAATNKNKATDKEALAKKLAESLSLAEIKQLLGHSNSKTTKKYVH